MNSLLTVISNIFYLITGIALLTTAPAVAIGCIFLGVASGIHHWKMEAWSRKLDYCGMYWVLLSIIFSYFGISGALNIALSFGIAATVGFFIVSQTAVAVGILFILFVAALQSLILFWVLGCIMILATVLNYMGDEVHPESHNIFHSCWHFVSASAIYLTVIKLL